MIHSEPITLRVGLADTARHRIHRSDGVVRITPIQARLLDYLAIRSPSPVSSDELLSEVWGYRAGVRTGTVKATMRALRLRVERDAGNPDHIITVRGSGYRFVPMPPCAASTLARLADEPSLDPGLRRRLALARIDALSHDDPAHALAELERLGPGTNPEAQIRLAGLLGTEGRVSEAQRALDVARCLVGPAQEGALALVSSTIADRIGDKPAALRHLQEAATSPALDVRHRARIRTGALLLDMGRVQEGFSALTEARRICAEAPRLRSEVLVVEGQHRLLQGRLGLAQAALRGGVNEAVQARSSYGERVARVWLALAMRLCNDHREADAEVARQRAMRVPRFDEPGLFAVRAMERLAAGITETAIRLVAAGRERHVQRPRPTDHALLSVLESAWTGKGLEASREVAETHGAALWVNLARAANNESHAATVAQGLDQLLDPALVDIFRRRR